MKSAGPFKTLSACGHADPRYSPTSGQKLLVPHSRYVGVKNEY